jgi:vacuolar-type H+-ATPase subunit H
MGIEGQGVEAPEILKRIQEVEAKVERMTEKAMMDANRMVMQAREQAERLLLDKREEVVRMRETALRQGVEAAECEAAEIIQKARQAVQDHKDRAIGKVEEAADLILQRVFPDLAGSKQA